MSKGPEIDAAAARKLADACSEFKLPKASEVSVRGKRRHPSLVTSKPGGGSDGRTLPAGWLVCPAHVAAPVSRSVLRCRGELPASFEVVWLALLLGPPGLSTDVCTPMAPPAPQDELRSLSRDEWMARYGGVLQSEQWFDSKAPEWNYDKNSW